MLMASLTVNTLHTANSHLLGMFLFAKLVLKHLQSQVSLHQFKRELEDLEDKKIKICLDDLYIPLSPFL